MPLATTIQPPSWIDSGAVLTGGLDLLGLRLPVQVIGGSLLDGITTVTPSVRYIGLRAWLIQRYGESGLPDSWGSFTGFAARIEAALVLGSLLQDRSINGLVGTNEALARLDAGAASLEITPLVKDPAATVYAGPSDQLGVTRIRGDAVPGLTSERGVPLASMVDRRLSALPLLRRLLMEPSLGQVPVDELRELGAADRIDRIPDGERALLVAALVPRAPLTKERARIGTYASLLALAAKLKRPPLEGDLFDAACSRRRFGEPLLDRIADGWTTYCIRDGIAVTQEAVLAAVTAEIIAVDGEGRAGVERDGIISGLMERIEEHASALRVLGLLETGESVTDLSFEQMYARIEARVAPGFERQHGLGRWDGNLIEPQLYKAALNAGAGALSLAVAAWILAAIRIGGAVEHGSLQYATLSYQGWRRMGLREVILPELERWRRENRAWRDVAAELAHRTVQQHLQTAWSRLQADLRRDVALLTAEGGRWFCRGKGFIAGRTASRLQRSLGWLEQLGLIGRQGITDEGDRVLREALHVLSSEAAA